MVSDRPAKLKVPAFGYTTVFAEPADGPTRYLGTMATSHRTIENHGGRITVESEPGDGARFHIELPVTPPAAAAGKR